METIHTRAAAINFPTTSEVFIAYQEQLVGRELSEKERGITATLTEVFNLSYEEGLRQDRAVLEEGLSKLKEFMTRHGEHAGVHEFFEACQVWMIEAWTQGKINVPVE